MNQRGRVKDKRDCRRHFRGKRVEVEGRTWQKGRGEVERKMTKCIQIKTTMSWKENKQSVRDKNINRVNEYKLTVYNGKNDTYMSNIAPQRVFQCSLKSFW